MEESPSRGDTLLELETRQDEVLRGLDELNARLERLLAEFKPEDSKPEDTARVISVPSFGGVPAARAA